MKKCFFIIYSICFFSTSGYAGVVKAYNKAKIKEADLSKALVSVDEMYACFKSANTLDATGKCALKYEYLNRYNQKDWKVFFKEHLVTYCKWKPDKVDCSKEIDGGFNKFFNFFYSEFKDPSLFFKHTESVNLKDRSLGPRFIYSIIKENYLLSFIKTSIKGNGTIVLRTAKDHAFLRLHIHGIDHRRYTKIYDELRSLKMGQDWARENEDYILNILNEPVKCFSKAKTSFDFLKCGVKYDNYMSRPLSDDFEGLLGYKQFVINAYCEKHKNDTKNCREKLTEKDFLKIMLMDYSFYTKKLTSLSGCSFSDITYRDIADVRFTINCLPACKKYKKKNNYNSFAIDNGNLRRPIKIRPESWCTYKSK
jgi:hypothetical protein